MSAAQKLGAALAVVAAAGFATASGAVPARLAIILVRPLPSLVRGGQHVTVSGRAQGLASCGHPCGATLVALEGRATLATNHPRAWRVLASSPVAASKPGFVLRWRVSRAASFGELSLRVVALRAGSLLASTRSAQVLIGPAPKYCVAAPPPRRKLPVGDGWIAGGAYLQGGPAPGIYACLSDAYTVTATDRAGREAGAERAAGGHGYALVLPAGSYTLRAGGCRGTATVTAGRRTRADSFCDVP
jgi:hypothetical protein